MKTMQSSSSFKHAFLKNMLLGLKLGGISSRSMSIHERKEAIKLSADVALAFARGGRNWSRAILADLCKQEKSKALVRSILGSELERLSKPCIPKWKVARSKKILRRSFRDCSRVRKGHLHTKGHGHGHGHGVASSAVLARNLVKKRTRILRSLIPGGEFLDDSSLLDEALDYVISLRAQVNLMRRLNHALGASSNLKSPPDCSLQERQRSEASRVDK